MTGKPTYDQLEQRVRELEKEASKLLTAEKALRESEKRHSQIVQGSSIPTFVINDKHMITHCNRAYERLTGISAKEVIETRKQWLSFYSEERPVMADLIVDRAPEDEFLRYYGNKYRKSAVTDGGYEAEDFFPALGETGRWIFFTAAPLRDADGNVTGAIETLQDVTERKQAEEALRESERRLRTLLDFVPYPITVFTLDGLVYYLNPSFTKTFGWTLQELEGKTIPYVPPGMEQETRKIIKRLLEKKVLPGYETKRLTKDGRILDVIMRAAVYSESEDEPAGELVLLRDITQEKRNTRNNEAMLRISMALPQYPALEELLDYISDEIKALLGSEGALVILLDKEKEELFFLGVAYDDEATEKRMKEIRFPLDQLVAGKVIKTGKPIIVSDTSKDPHLHQERDKKLGYHTKNLLLVPLRSSDRIIGVISAINKKEGTFGQADVELLSMIAGTVALSIENARVSEELKKAYREVTSLNRAKDKVINHLSHELKTPVSVLSGSLSILERRLVNMPLETWKPTVERAKRNLNRLMDIQYEVDDIIQGKHDKEYNLLSLLLNQCTDELETLVAQEVGESPIIETLRRRVDEIFGPKKIISERIPLDEYTRKRLEVLKPLFSHRQVEIISRFEATPPIDIPQDILDKVIDGLVKNAIENTPDEGKVEVLVRKSGEGTELVVHDYGVGIKEDDQRRIFEGFFPTQDTMKYSSKRPFDFNAGGKGGDLLRMKIFSGRYHFRIHMNSSRCLYISKEDYTCPGIISKCVYCEVKEDCHQSGETIFSLYFPPALERNWSS